MTDIKEYTSTLSMPEKVELFNDLYGELAGYGTEGDTELAHVNTFEARLLKSIGGSGTINEITGLRQFGGGGGQPPPPAQTTVNQQASFPEELRPFVKDVLTQGQAEFERQQEEGYQTFPGPQLADFSPEQLAAQEAGRQQFTGLAGTPLGQASTYYQPALAATALGTAEIGTEDIQRRMDPFLQNVVDVAKREARRDEDLAAQGRAAQAVGAGSFGGSRQAIVESEAERNLAERLGDIQARGLSSAFQNAQQAAEAQRARELSGGRQFAALGDITGTRARSDLSGLAGIGEIQQQREQQALDLARREFLEEQAFPQTSLQQYASLIRGFPLQASQQRFAQETLPTPSLSQTLVGGLGTAAGLYGAFGGFKKEGGLVGLQGGGQPMMDQQQPNELDTIEMLRQRGAAIRGLSEPVGGGGVVNRFMGSKVVSAAIQKEQGGEGFEARPTNDGVMNLILQRNPKFLRKLKALGMGTSGGGRKTSYAEYNPGTQGGQYAGGGIVSLATSGAPNWFTRGEDPSMRGINSITSDEDSMDLHSLYQMILNRPIPEYSEEYETKNRQLQEIADLIKQREGRLQTRYEDLEDDKFSAQMINVAKLMSQFGQSTSPAAQQPGVRGLLGAFADAGAATLPDFISTEEEYKGKRYAAEDEIEGAKLEGLQADLAVTESSLADQQAIDDKFYDIRSGQLALGIDMRTSDAAYQSALADWAATGADSGDVNSAMRTLGTALNAEIQTTADGHVYLKGRGIDDQTEFAHLVSNYVSAIASSNLEGADAQEYGLGAIWEERRKTYSG